MDKFDSLQKTLWILIYCKACGHCLDVDKSYCQGFASRLGIPLDKLSQLHFKNHARQFECEECGSQGARVEIEKRGAKVSSQLRVATHNSIERVFHRPKCGWMRNVSAIDEIKFKNRSVAIERGYQPCKSCHP